MKRNEDMWGGAFFGFLIGICVCNFSWTIGSAIVRGGLDSVAAAVMFPFIAVVLVATMCLIDKGPDK